MRNSNPVTGAVTLLAVLIATPVLAAPTVDQFVRPLAGPDQSAKVGRVGVTVRSR